MDNMPADNPEALENRGDERQPHPIEEQIFTLLQVEGVALAVIQHVCARVAVLAAELWDAEHAGCERCTREFLGLSDEAELPF